MLFFSRVLLLLEESTQLGNSLKIPNQTLLTADFGLLSDEPVPRNHPTYRFLIVASYRLSFYV